jgi:hypothetical protein
LASNASRELFGPPAVRKFTRYATDDRVKEGV